MTLEQLLDDVGLTGARDPDGTLNFNRPPTPLPERGTYYAVTEVIGDGLKTQLQGGAQDRTQIIQVGLYGAPDTTAGRNQLLILVAHLRYRAREVTAHVGLRLRECLPGDPLPVRRDVGTATQYAYVRYTLHYLAP